MTTSSDNLSKDPSGPVRVRFAPSPTGSLHIGGVRTALYDWILARKTGGKFILRIEDTDQKRTTEDSVQSIYEGLRWLGLEWDEGPDIGGPHGPYIQSERREMYSEAIERLLESGAAYLCDCTPERLEALRERQKAAALPPGYDGRCRTRSRDELEESRKKGIPIVVRFRVPDHESLTFHDVVRGEVTFDLSKLSDFVVLKSDGLPTYHLAHVVDDHDMQITHVLRGEEWISSTPRHVLIHRGLGIEPPAYVHLPILLGKDRSKLSKRHGAAAALEYRDAGYIPDAMFNFLSLLGWSPGDDTELMSRDEIVRRFSLERINESAAIFDAEKLEWMNGVYIRQMAPEKLADSVIPALEAGLPSSVSRPVDHDYVTRLIPLVRERLRRITEAPEMLDFFFVDDIEVNPAELPQKNMDAASTADALKAALNLCRSADTFEPEPLEAQFRALAEELGLKPGQLFGAIRVAVTGKRVAPPLFDTLAAIGRERCIERLEKAISALEGAASPV